MKSLLLIFIVILMLISRGETKCTKDCEELGLDIICASDGITWYNEHCMRACSSDKQVEIMYKGVCKEYYALHPKGGLQEQLQNTVTNSCTSDCQLSGPDFVCGTDDLTWYNEDCMSACSSTELKEKGPCPDFYVLYPTMSMLKPNVIKNVYTDAKCIKSCEESGQDLACANDGRVWYNENCMYACSGLENVRVLYKGTCKEFYKQYPKLGTLKDKVPLCKDCKKYGDKVVCATDGMSWYNIQCMAACSAVEDVRAIHEGVCRNL